MKSIAAVCAICLLGVFTSCQGQEKRKTQKETTISQKEIVKTDSSKQMNLLDEQTKMFGQIFDLGGAGKDNPLSGATNYLELIEKMEGSEEQKKQLREIYNLYDTSLDSKKKEELKAKVDKMLTEAMDKSQNNSQ